MHLKNHLENPFGPKASKRTLMYKFVFFFQKLFLTYSQICNFNLLMFLIVVLNNIKYLDNKF